MLRHHDASEVWGRPLRDGSFVVVLLNKGDAPANVTLRPSYDAGGGDGAHCDLYDRIDYGKRVYRRYHSHSVYFVVASIPMRNIVH